MTFVPGPCVIKSQLNVLYRNTKCTIYNIKFTI